jgi:hypothetical protein
VGLIAYLCAFFSFLFIIIIIAVFLSILYDNNFIYMYMKCIYLYYAMVSIYLFIYE